MRQARLVSYAPPVMVQRYELPGFLVRKVVHPVVSAVPGLKSVLKSVRDAALRVFFLPHARSRPAGRAVESAELVDRTDELNRAAEDYFAHYEDREFILGKPYSEPRFFAKRLFDVGVLAWHLRLAPGDTVVELGAGTCWISHFLNRFGCRTCAVDVSRTALELGQELFSRDPATRWDLEPRFLVYDGHHIPLPDASCDAVLVNDAFHHIPNQREILSEMARILKPAGIAAMCEPGRQHSRTEASREEVERTGVLENDIVVENLALLARQCGFSEVNLVPLTLLQSVEISATDLGAFMRGKDFGRYWAMLCDGLEEGHYIVLHKRYSGPTTCRPGRLGAWIRIRAWRPLKAKAGEPLRLGVRVRNDGDTLWLADRSEEGGWTRLGIHLYRGDGEGELLDFDWFRAELPRDVEPRQRLDLDLELPPLTEPGNYRLVLDLVVEGRTWFAERGSEPREARLRVVAS